MNHPLLRLAARLAPMLVPAFVACIEVGHDAETGCLVDTSAPGCRAARGGASNTGGSGVSGSAGSGNVGGTDATGGTSTGGTTGESGAAGAEPEGGGGGA